MAPGIKTVAVLGSGTMGQGIAQTLAINGFQVNLRDIEQSFVDRGMATTKANLDRFFVQKGRMSAEQAAEALARVTPFVDLGAAVANADFVIEAAPENFELKKKIFADLDRLAPPNTMFASNTSVLSVTGLAGATKRPEKVCGMHFFNPVAIMRLVEIVCPLGVAEETIDAAFDVAKRMGKEPIRTKDTPGFIVNRVLMGFYNIGAKMVLDGVASAEDIDRAMRLGANMPMGPCELSDFGGLDVVLGAAQGVYEMTADPADAPNLLFRKMVEAGRLGRKNGKGFYDYDAQGNKRPAKLF